ncbi:6-carboxytetrahydropterin synthase [Candidatus Microgenomates bacterium]|nr:6-carboxytetrahydropterin synthase [Candidatus Microgenomates bacterium]
MALLGTVFKLKASHEGFGRPFHEHEFKIVVVFEGEIENGAVAGLDFHQAKAMVIEVLAGLEGKRLNEFFEPASVENLAVYILRKLKKLPIKSIRVWEAEDRFAEVFKKEIGKSF